MIFQEQIHLSNCGFIESEIHGQSGLIIDDDNDDEDDDDDDDNVKCVYPKAVLAVSFRGSVFRAHGVEG